MLLIDMSSYRMCYIYFHYCINLSMKIIPKLGMKCKVMTQYCKLKKEFLNVISSVLSFLEHSIFLVSSSHNNCFYSHKVINTCRAKVKYPVHWAVCHKRTIRKCLFYPERLSYNRGWVGSARGDGIKERYISPA